jgi:hypothetical protein
MGSIHSMLVLVIGTAVVMVVASIPWSLCREGQARSPTPSRFSLPGALCACFVALAAITVVGSTALLNTTQTSLQ